MNWYRLKTEEVFEKIKSDEKGLSTDEAKRRRQKFGPNELQEAKKRSIAIMLLAQFKDFMILILLAAAIISGVIGDITDTIVILVIVVLNAIIGFFQEYRAEKAMQALKQMAVVQANALRDGNAVTLPATELVPGDIILLEAGSAVPADIRIIESNSLKVEEAALTGESHAIDKISDVVEEDNLPIGDQTNLAFKGTFVANGRGKGVVFATGMKTELGRIAKMLQESETLTPLQQRMASFSKKTLGTGPDIMCRVFYCRLVAWRRYSENGAYQYLTRRCCNS